MRRAAVAVPVLVLSACGQPAEVGPDPAAWQAYRDSYITPAGRVVDTGQGGISHSEGQAYALLLAEAAGDRGTFERVWSWTRSHLAIRPDGLLAWRWEPGPERVTDRNNATDGDLIAAWALLRAAARWDSPAYRMEAWRRLNAIESALVVEMPVGPVLLPGADGFVHEGVVTVNLSYWVFPALTDLRRLDPAGPWQALHRTGVALLASARFGEWGLPADWIQITDPVAPAEAFPARFGFEALRIPLYACWDGMGGNPDLQGVADFWSSTPTPPAWIGLDTAEIAPFPLAPGAMAIRSLLLASRATDPQADTPVAHSPDYYDATLALLADLARHEAGD